MRNLKKLFAVILTVAMLASMMVPALAANNYEAEATKLQSINVFAGGPADLKLDEGVTRIQGLAFAIRAAGKDADALAMDAAEVDTILADWTDAADIPAWGRNYAAYAIKNSITVGLSATEKIFGAMNPISGTSFLVFVMKSGMGYANVTTADVVDAAVTAGILTAGQAVTFGAKEALIRDDAAGILFGAFSTGVNADGTKLIDAYIASGATTLADAVDAGFVTANTMSVEAEKVDTLVASFAYAVDPADINIAVTKGGGKVDAAAPVWSDGNTVATIKTTAKMTNGTYTVTATSASDEDFELTGTVEITSQYVAEIVILNDVALTGKDTKDSDRAYVYYDVLDQYGESLRTSTNIEWSFSVQKVQDDRAAGKITLKRSDNNAFTYGEKIYITGVYSRTGISVTKEVTVGMKQALDSIEVVGFVKKGTTEMLTALPSGFKDGAYYMLYAIKDQNGNSVSYDTPIKDNEVTFISDNVLLIKEIVSNDGKNETKLVIDGVEYNAVFVTPGMSVDKGGEANITAIANKTGNKTVLNVVVGENQILTSFVMSAPSTMIADNEKVEIPFVALDQNGNAITNFVTLAKQKTFNTLSFTASSGSIVLSEKDDGTAKLEYNDEGSNIKWSDSQATDEIDRMVSITSVVTGGDYSGILLNIQDRARPEAIKTVDLDNVLVESGSDKLYLNNEGDDKDYKSSFVFLDQYGREMKAKDAGAFFKAAATKGGIAGTNYADYAFKVRATYKGAANLFSIAKKGDALFTPLLNDAEIILDYSDFVEASKTDTEYYEIKATGNVSNAQSGNSLRFDIVKSKEGFKKTTDPDYDTQSVSSARNVDLAIVDITAVRNFRIDDVKKFYIDTTANEADTFALANVGQAITDTISNENFETIEGDYKHEVKVKGSYNGKDVTIPAAEYLQITSGKLVFDENGKLDSTSPNAIKWSDFYDVTTAQYLRKDASDTVKAVIFKDKSTNETLDTISKSIVLSDAKPKETTIEGADTWAVAPDTTVIDFVAVQGNKDDKYSFKVFDQYGVDITASMSAKTTYKISSIEPNADGYADNNFTVENNDTATVKVSKGAERGDTFVLTIKAGDVSKEVKVTVKADKKANITATKNNYLDVLIGEPTGTALEKQRLDGLN